MDTREKIKAAMNISVIIPTFNEESKIEVTLKRVQEEHKPYEVIVSDGGSQDRTAEIASRWGRVVQSERGRANQMNHGAAAAKGDIFLFLHADTTLPPRALEMIQIALKDTRKRSGRFRMSFGSNHPLLRFYSYQTRFHFFSYGDQAFFVTRGLFQDLNGFCVHTPFEDITFIRDFQELKSLLF